MSLHDDTIKEQIKDNILPVVASYIELNSRMQALCPFHEEKTPSFSVDTDNQMFKCFGCSESGDALAFIAKKENLDMKSDFKIILKKGCDILNLGTSKPITTLIKKATPKPKNEDPWDYSPVANACHQILKNIVNMPKKTNSRRVVLGILEASGFTDEHIKAGNLGWDSLSNMITLPYFDGELCPRLKLINKLNPKISTSHYPWEIHRDNKIHLKYNEENKGFSSRKHTKPTTPPKFYNHAVLNGTSEVYLLAGEKDCITAMINGVFNVISNYFGEGNINEGMAGQLKGKDVVVIYDVDDAGIEGAKGVALALAPHAHSIKIIDLSGVCKDGEDLTDYFIKHKKEKSDLIKLVNQTKKEAKPKATTSPIEATTNTQSLDTPHKLSVAFIDSIDPIIYDPTWSCFFMYEKSVWENLNKEYLDSYIYTFLVLNAPPEKPALVDPKIGDKMATIVKRLNILPKGIKMNGNTDLFNVQNGMIDTSGDITLIPHDKKYYSSIQMPVTYDPHATCDQFLKFIKEVCGGDQEQIDIIQEMFGYCLTSSTQAQKGFFLKGGGGDGKGVLLKILASMLGDDHVSRREFRELGNQFGKQWLYGKLVNISEELSHKIDCETGTYKSLVTGDEIHAEQKNNNTLIKYSPTAKMIFAGNNLPRVTDDSHGFSRRPIILCFDGRFSDSGKMDDRYMLAKLKKELSGIFMWSLDGLSRLRDEGEPWVFTYSLTSENALKEWGMRINPIRQFIADKCFIGDGYKIETALLYGKYDGWCKGKGHGRNIKADNEFGEFLLNEYPVKKSRLRNISGDRVQTYVGIRHSEPSM